MEKRDLSASKNPLSDDNKEMIRTESRPIGTTTWFTGAGDVAGDIGGGKELAWDFSNDDDIIAMPSGESGKRKRLEFSFIDYIHVKDGKIYFHNAIKDSYIEFHVVCPDGQYYYDNNNNLQQADGDTIISTYVNKQRFQGTCPMGDELVAEVCSGQIPSYYKFWIDVTVPSSDNSSNGYVRLEVYRTRTVIL